MKAPYCKTCETNHYGTCLDQGNPGQRNSESVRPETRSAVHDGKRLLARHDEGDGRGLQEVRKPKLAQGKARDAKGDVGSKPTGARKVGRPKSAEGPRFDRVAYQREYMKKWRKTKATKET